MSWNRRVNDWFASHPILYAVVLGGSLGLVHIGLNVLFNRPYSWTSMILWVVVFPTIMASIARARAKAERDA